MLNELTEKEGEILLWIQDNLRNDFLTPIFKGITYLGTVGWFWIVVCAALLFWKKYRRVGIYCSVSLFVTFVIAALIKLLIARERPYEMIEGLTRLVGEQSNHSFPSGHATAAFSVSVIMLALMPKKFGVTAFVLAILISFSRLYVGVHYPTDVLAGAALATVVALILVKIYKCKEIKVTE